MNALPVLQHLTHAVSKIVRWATERSSAFFKTDHLIAFYMILVIMAVISRPLFLFPFRVFYFLCPVDDYGFRGSVVNSSLHECKLRLVYCVCGWNKTVECVSSVFFLICPISSASWAGRVPAGLPGNRGSIRSWGRFFSSSHRLGPLSAHTACI